MIEGFFRGLYGSKARIFLSYKGLFFSDVSDFSIMSNKENGNYVPHYYAIEDSKNKDIF